MKKVRVEVWLNWVGTPLAAIYIFCMFVYPWKSGGWKWAHVHAVWHDWQTLNAAMLAFLASLIALNISRFRDEKQRERDFLASKAFLPAAFSELSDYFKKSAEFLVSAWNSEGARVSAPLPAESYRSVFLESIRHATPEVGEYLTELLVQLQVHESRLEELNRRSDSATDRHTLIPYMLALGKLKVLVDRQFDFARGRERFNEQPASWEDFRNAYSILDLHLELYAIDENFTLQSLTERYLARTNGAASGTVSPALAWLRRHLGKTE